MLYNMFKENYACEREKEIRNEKDRAKVTMLTHERHLLAVNKGRIVPDITDALTALYLGNETMTEYPFCSMNL